MSNIILQPTGNKDAREHFRDTIENKVGIEKFKPYISKELYKEIEELNPSGRVAIWGVTNGDKNRNKNSWLKIKPGDVALFAKKKRIYKTAVITKTFEKKELAEAIWGVNKENETWENIYLVDELQNIDISYELLNQIVGYKPNNNVQGFTYLNDQKSEYLLNYLGLHSVTYIESITDEDFEKEIERLQNEKTLDNSYSGTSRKEQSYLRKKLFHNKRSSFCSICGEEFPVELLVAAHIKKRAECNNEERLDVNNIVVPMCKFGCDDLYEKGYILVEDGIIKINSNKWIPKSVSDYLNKISNQTCTAWNEGTMKYFIEHNKKFKND